MTRAVLASDVHLSADDPATADAFLGLLPRVTAGAQRLFLLGDLFDAWIGDDLEAGSAGVHGVDGRAVDAPGACAGAPSDSAGALRDASDPLQAAQDALALRAADTLRRIADRGTAVALAHGNRDFLLGERYASACGAVLLPEQTVVTLGAQPALLTHGDELCTGDLDYQRVRAQVRAPAWQAAMLAQPRAVRAATGRRLRGQSEAAKRDKAEAIMDVDPEAVAALMRARGVRLLVHGHTHRPATHRFELDGAAACRRVLPDWDADAGRGGFLVVDEQGWHMIDAFGPSPGRT